MVTYTKERIEALINCRKSIVGGDKSAKLERAYRRMDLRLTSDHNLPDGKTENFKTFIRHHLDLAEEFPIGLMHFDENGQGNILLRCNGKQARHQNKVIDNNVIHDEFHIHKGTVEAINENIKLEQWAYKTDAYGSFEGAVAHFVDLVNIGNAEEYLESLLRHHQQPSLWD